MELLRICYMAALIALAYCQVRSANDLQDALQILGLTKFLHEMREAGFSHMLYNRNKYTLFAPTNEAFARFEARISHSDTGSLTKDNMKDILLYHMAYSDWRAEDWTNEQLIPTALRGMNIRVNSYAQTHSRKGDEKVITMSGVQVLSNNNKARNGIVHVLNDVIYPMPMASAYETLSSMSNTRHFTLLLDEVNLMKLLRYCPRGPYYKTLDGESLTVFAPVDEAFRKLPPQFMDTVESQLAAMAALLNYHVVNGTFYTAGLFRNTRMHTMEGSDIMIETEAYESNSQQTKLKGDAKIIRSYPVTNGVLHIIDRVLTPPAHPKQMFYAAKERIHDSQREMRRKK